MQIREKQYEDALELAIKYNLNKDLVYKHQWCNSLVLEETINNILVNIKYDIGFYINYTTKVRDKEINFYKMLIV